MRRLIIPILSLAVAVSALTVFRADALPPTIDLNTTAADLTVYGDDPWDASGFAVAAGDINGDGKDDLIIGAWWADPAGRDQAGETYVIYGGGSLPSTIDLNSTSASLTVYGDDAGDQSGYSVAAGDINGDTTDDLIIGAYSASPAGGVDAGETYVIYGGPSLPATIDLNSTSAGLTVYGDDASDHSGDSVAAGDINGDTTDDLIIGAHWAWADPAGGLDAGETYVIYGGPGLPATIDLNSAPADLTVYGDDADDESGMSVAAGDIDGDTYDDLIIGAPYADPAGGANAGETYVIYGGTPGTDLPAVGGTIDLNSTPAGLTVYGDDAHDWSGYTVSAGNINGDTYDDLIIGARRADPAGGVEAGETYVIYGGTPGTGLPAVGGAIDLNSASAGLTVYGDDAVDQSGVSVAAGDIDGDTTDDLIIGAGLASPAGGDEAGETYVIYGGPSLPATIDLNSPGTSADLTVYGDDACDGSGSAVAAGDIDGDTTEDVIIGAPSADPAGGGAAGETYVIYGGCPDDGDGIAAEIDVLPGGPCVFSNHFDDRPLGSGGTTFGEVTLRSNPSNLNVNVTDLANPEGVSMTAKGPGGALVQIRVCGFLPLTFSLPGQTKVKTCGSAVVEVVSGGSVMAELGSVSAELVAGTTVTISEVSPGRFQVTNWASSTASINIDGLVLAPGESATVPVIPVGGVSVDIGPADLPLEAAGSSGANYGVVAAVAAAVTAGALAVGGAAWWARRRWVR